MKRVVALLLVALLAIGMVGCSGGGKKSDESKGTESDKVADESTGKPEDEDDKSGEDNDAPYTLYDDFPTYVKVPFHELYISTSTWRNDDAVYAWRLSNSLDYVVVVSYHDDEEKYTGSLDDILDFTYENFTGAIGEHALTNEFGEYNLTSKEKVMLDCGSEAIKFEGTMSANEYSRVVDYYVYGYSFVYDDVALTIGASVVNPDAIDENKDTMKDIVDRMVKTVRTQP